MAIIPAYNESESIGKIISETSKHVSSVIVVDDGSKDNTAEVAVSMNAKVVRNKYNTGKGAALKRGLIECLKYNPDIVVTLDGDGQHDPAEIPKLLEPVEKNKLRDTTFHHHQNILYVFHRFRSMISGMPLQLSYFYVLKCKHQEFAYELAL
jgi:glycosyltransferase involved in cell wall biosynthesis